ncbi:MAG: DUF58 domain-containing protein [Chloroflexi bacterium]|nr:MAG: DUF58 domain-containing protein [Chloroflexota bacterium]TMD90964.1 MAG: DUF58 domain-containing protein [Chloroflexota bacterium]
MNKVALAVALGILLGFTYLTGYRPAYAFSYALCLLFVVAWVWPKIAIRGISLSRRLDPGTPTVGEPYEEVIEVRRIGWVPAPWVEIRDLGQIPDYQPGRVISVGGELVSWKSRGVYRRRGWMSFGPTLVSVREPFGLFNQEVKTGNRNTVLVYPRVRPIPDLMTPSAQQVGSSQSLGAWADYPPDTSGVRDYVTGDSFGRIHWPLSTRHARLMSKTFEQPLTTDLWILLDLDRNVHCGEGEESTVEYAVSLAASMASQVHSRGRQVGLIANDSRGTVLEPHRAVRQDRIILDYLAVATADGRTPLTQTLAWDRIRRLPRRAIAVITPSADEAWVRLLQAVRGRRSSMIVFFLDGASFGGPDQNPTFDLGQDVDLYVVRKGDDFARLMRTRDAIRIG